MMLSCWLQAHPLPEIIYGGEPKVFSNSKAENKNNNNNNTTTTNEVYLA
jgi:hypothetical protein